jgi:hypothetical protein
MKRKFQHYAILVITRTILFGLTSLAVFGWFSVVYHLIFNSPTITFGGW